MPDTRSIIQEAISTISQESPGDTLDSDTSTDPALDAAADDTPTSDTPDPDPAARSDDATPVPAPADKKPEEKKPDEPNEDFEKEPTVDARGRENRIPSSRVSAMVKRSVAKAVEARDREHAEKSSAYEAELQRMQMVGQIADTDPERFLQMLAASNEAYRKYLTPSPAAENDHSLPGPDLADGSYSPAQFQRLLDTHAGGIEKRITERYKWLDDQHAADQVREAAVPKVRALMAEAQSWYGFQEHANEIIAALKADSEQAARTGQAPRLTLEAAYRQVITSKFQAERESLRTDKNAMRQQILQEINARPTSTSATALTPVPRQEGDDGTPKSSREIIQQVVAGMRR